MSESNINSELPKEEQQEIQTDTSANANPPVTVDLISDLFKQMKIDEQLRTDIGPSETIDVIPDFRYIVLQLIDHATKIYQQIAQFSVPDITPASLIAIMLDTLYTYGAVADVWNVRQYTSQYGKDAIDQRLIEQSLTLACYNAVPPFLHDILRGLQHTFDPRRKNLAYIYSFAAFDFPIDFGRCYPTHMFLALHNLIAESTSEDTLQSIWLKWLDYIVIQTATETVKVANIIGAAYGENLVDNFMSTPLKKLLTPMSIIGAVQRKILTPFEFDVPIQPETLENINPYIYLLGNEQTMIPRMMDFRNLLRTHIYQMFDKSIPLFMTFSVESGSQIMNHIYCQPTLPTYHSLSFTYDRKKTPTISTLDTYANKLNYKCTWRCIQESDVTIKVPPVNRIIPALYLGQDSNTKPLDPDSYISYTDESDPAPWIIYLPYSTGKASTYYPVTSGITIESFEIDGFGVPFPTDETSIHDENSHFLNSAIPIKSVINRSHINGIHVHPIRYRAQEHKHQTKVSLSIGDMSKHYLPYFPTDVRSSGSANPLPAFTVEDGITNPSQATTKIAINGSNITDAATTDAIHTLKFYAWSSYRWIDRRAALLPTWKYRTYFLMNMRTIYGTLPETMMMDPLPVILEQH